MVFEVYWEGNGKISNHNFWNWTPEYSKINNAIERIIIYTKWKT
jgi:hypothetical protein